MKDDFRCAEIDNSDNEPIRIIMPTFKNYGWISVKDRLPDDMQVIAYCSKTAVIGGIGRYCADPSDHMPSARWDYSWEDVTHWMALQEPK